MRRPFGRDRKPESLYQDRNLSLLKADNRPAKASTSNGESLQRNAIIESSGAFKIYVQSIN